MTYNPQEWRDGPDGGTPITAARLNHLETQYQAAYDTVAADLDDPGTPVGAALVTVVGDMPGWWIGTQAAYDQITPKDPNTLYLVVP